MAIKKSELYSSLWASCDELRGSMDASQYKDYVLVMLFMKYVSDRVKREKADGKTPLIEIPEGASFYDMLKYRGKDDIGNKINTVIGEFAKANYLTGVITEADFNDDAKLGTGKDKRDLLTNLLNIFNREELDFSKNRAEGDDLLGDAYEYLMRHFATESGKSKGQFYTPAEVSRIMAQVIGIDKSTSQSQTIYDPTCGSGSLLLKAADLAPHGISIYGIEFDNATRALAVMNMWLHNFADAEIKQANAMSSEESQQFTEEKTGELKAFDYAVANPPFSYKKWMNGLDPKNDIYKRFEGYDNYPPKKNGDFAFLLHLIKSLKSKGKACIVLPLGVLFRGNAESDIRKKIIQKGYIKGIIGLPPNLFYGTGIAASLIIIDKEDAAERKSIFMVDASKGFIKDGNKNRLREQDIHQIVDTFNKKLTTNPKYAREIPISEIADPKNDYNLNIPRYIDSQEPEDIQDIEAHLRGGIPARDIDALNKYWQVYPSMKADLFTAIEGRPEYFNLNIAHDEIKNSIYHHAEFTAFSAEMEKVFTEWKTEMTTHCKALEKGLHPKEQIRFIAEKLLKQYANRKLTDKYAMYQHMMDYWAETMQDDFYELAADGWIAGNEVKRIEKKTKKGDEEVIKQVAGIDGLEGRLIPPRLLIQEFFPTEKKQIEDLEEEIETIVSEKTELQEEHGGEEAALQGVSTKKDAEAALSDFIIQAMEEYYPADYSKYESFEKQAAKNQATLKENASHAAIELLKNAKGSLTQKALKDGLEAATEPADKKVIENYLDALKNAAKSAKEIKTLVETVADKLETNIKATPDAEYLKEIGIIRKYLELLVKESEKKAELKKALDELEIKVIAKYPKLTIDDIKTTVVDKKWMGEMESRIKTEMDNISHRLTQRIKELAERYESTLPELTNSLTDLSAKVETHLKKMKYTW